MPGALRQSLRVPTGAGAPSSIASVSEPSASPARRADWGVDPLAGGVPTRPKPKRKIQDHTVLPNWALQLPKAGLDFCCASMAHVCGGCAPADGACLLDCKLGVRPSQLNASTLGRPSDLERV